jgi:hypothetical protein
MTVKEQLRGWGFDINGLKEGERALSSQPPKATRAISTNHPNNTTILKEDEWCHYGGLPSPKAYMEESER